MEEVRAQLVNERASFIPHWQELSDFILPRRSRFNSQDRNRGGKRNHNIIDSTATLSQRTASSGMMAGITSPARPWFKLSSPKQYLGELPPVKFWLSDVENSMRNIHLRSNLYNVLPGVYGDMFTFGTGCIFQDEDPDDIMRFYLFPVGSYVLGTDAKGRVRVFMREFDMTVRQVVEKFGEVKGDKIVNGENLSTNIISQWESNSREAWVTVVHAVLPNPEYNPSSRLSKHKQFLSAYYEFSANGDATDDTFLSVKGYDYFPILAPRWEVTGNDVYATNCPGMVALGDIKQLQFGEKRTAKAIDKMIDPPIQGPSAKGGVTPSLLPGDVTYHDSRGNEQGFRSIHEVRFDIGTMENKQSQIRNRIQRAYFEDLFLMLAQSDRRQITATEIMERKEEKMLALGPVLEQVNQDLLDPLISNSFAIMKNFDQIPEPPKEIQGQEIKVEYVSIMAQAQKVAGIGAIERLTNFVGMAAKFDESAIKKIDINETIDIYADLTGVPVKMVRTNDQLEAMMQQEMEAQQLAQQTAQAQEMISGAKQLSEIKTDEKSALTDLMEANQAGSLV